MIINTGQRTDIPAFYTPWFLNRLREGYVLVRSPYDPTLLTRYVLSPEVVDLIGFCTKNPAPMLPHLSCLSEYGQFWYVTITPYGTDIELHVPDYEKVTSDFQRLSDALGPHRVGWRYDPILVSRKYTLERHLETFEQLSRKLEGYTHTVVISFIDLYVKTQRNFPQVREVTAEEQHILGKAMAEMAMSHGMTLRPCMEGTWLSAYGADCSGCMTVAMYESALREHLLVPRFTPARKGCACYLGADIGAYNTCLHMCRYCYANEDWAQVQKNHAMHDPHSPLLIGHVHSGDTIRDAHQTSWRDGQIMMEAMWLS